MRNLIAHLMISLDGFYAGPNGEIDWHRVDEDFHAYSESLLRNSDTLFFGRKTYEIMAAYWPTEKARRDLPAVAALMNGLPKKVFSHSLENVLWEGSELLQGNLGEIIGNWKSAPGREGALLGSSELAVSLCRENLIHEFRISICPVLLGSGKRLMNGLTQRLNLELLGTREFQSGLVLMRYRPEASRS